MALGLECLVLSTVNFFCIVQKQKGVADAMIEADFLLQVGAVIDLSRLEIHRASP